MDNQSDDSFDEKGVKSGLCNWILSHHPDAAIFWEKHDASDNQCRNFEYTGDSGRPDVLVVTEDTHAILEIKGGTSSNNIYDAMSQLHEYWQEAEYGDASVLTDDGEIIPIDTFLIGSQFSPQGRLFKKERENNRRETYDPDEEWYEEGNRPQYEWARSEAIPRIQWRYAWREAEQRGQGRSSISIGVGSLLSSKLDRSSKQDTVSEFSANSSEAPHSTPKLLHYTGESNSEWRGF